METPSFIGLRRLALAALLAAGVTTGWSANYQFSGAQGFGLPFGPTLGGTLQLDQLGSRNQVPLAGGENGSVSTYSSPNNILDGAFGGWTFFGVAEITVTDRPAFWSGGQENFSPDSWIARAPVTGNWFNNLTPTFISLFYYTSAGALTDSALLPPNDPWVNPNPFDFQFVIELSDANGVAQDYVSGQLFTIQSVPEPTAASLLVLGGAALAFWRRRNR